MSIRKRLIALVVLAVAAGTVSLFLWRSAAQPKIRNVLLISIDTCRADHLSCYGYPKAITPNIDALSQQGILFEKVLSPVPQTLPAHCSMLAGTIPVYHGVHLNFDYQLDSSNTTLAEILKDEGFATGAVVSAYVLDSLFGLNQGFDTYYDKFDATTIAGKQRRGDEVNRYAFNWLTEHREARFFLFLHYYDPHEPYDPPEPFASRFADSPYAGEVAFTDHCIGQVIDKLKEFGLYDSTLIVITADHGEMLGEHGELAHGFFLYESAVKVPLIFILPGQYQPREIEQLVGLVDIVPTVCGLLSINPGVKLQGMDLSDCIRNETELQPGRELYCESLIPTSYDANSLLGLVIDDWKYIQTTRPELYDLTNDPGETKNLVSTEAPLASDMQGILADILETQFRVGADAQLDLDERSRQQLESLGYVGGGSENDAFEFDVSKDDPKGLIDFHNSALKMIKLKAEKKYAEAKSLGKRLIEQRPKYAYGQRLLGAITMEEGDNKTAIAYFRKALELNPDDREIHNKIGLALYRENELDESIKHLHRALELLPNDALAHHTLGLALRSQYKLDEAISHFRRAVELQPTAAVPHADLANTVLAQGKTQEAINHFRQALELQPNLVDAHYMWGIALSMQGKTDEAIQRYKETLRIKPDHAQAHYQLGKILALNNRFAEAVESFRRVVRLTPNQPKVLSDFAWILATCPDDSVRNADEAVKLAERACELTARKNPNFLDTLAAAQAQAGQFDKAVSTMQAAIDLAQRAQATEMAEGFKKRLELYQQNKPYHQSMYGAQ